MGESKHLFNVNRKDFYDGDETQNKITRNRLVEIADMGMSLVGVAEFGFKGVTSGLYIEMVWSFSDEQFNAYMDWSKSVIYKEAFLLAKKYIDESPCDPDIYPEQQKAWNEYKEFLKRLNIE